MGQAALLYARRGWAVFPCREREETLETGNAGPRTFKAKAPYTGKGLKDATRDEQRITSWWRDHPDALIGVPTGINGLFVLDFDPEIDPETGEAFTLDSLKADLEAQMGVPLPRSVTALTQSDGVHVWLKQPAEGEPIRNRGNLPRHVDVRGLGGYVIAPPSVMVDTGAKYRWLRDRGDWRDDDAYADAPAELIAILRAPKVRATNKADGDQPSSASSSSRPVQSEGTVADAAVRKYALAALSGEEATLRAAQSGSRNTQTNASAFAVGQLVGAGAIGEATARAVLQSAVSGFNDVPLAHRTIENGLTAGMAQPRDLSSIADAAARRGSWNLSGSRPPAPDEGGGLQSFRSEGSPPSTDHGGQGGEDDEEAVAARHLRCIHRPHTDLGNAERFKERYGDDFRWSPALGWLGWDGRRWVPLAQEEKQLPPEVVDAVFKTVRAIQDEAAVIEASGGQRPDWLDEWEALPEKEQWKLSPIQSREVSMYRLNEFHDEDALDTVVDYKKGHVVTRADMHRKWGRTSEANGKIGCIARLAQPWLAVRDDAFDADPLTVNCLNGTLRFRRVRVGDVWAAQYKLSPHDRADLISKLAPVEFDREAQCPLYDRTMGWAQEKQTMRRYLHQWGGLSMTGHMGEQKLHFWYGLGGNGKSTIMDAWCSVLGDYTTTVPIETFLDQGVKRRGDQATPELARLGGVRLLRTSEPERGAKLAAALIKLVTGGEPMSVRFLNRGFFDLRPIFKMTIQGNFRPQIADTDEGIWRRVKLIPWPQNIDKPPAGATDWPTKDPELSGKLRVEASGIMNRLVDGVLDWLENGLVEPKEVTAATADYRTESDPLARFLKLCTRPEPDGRVQSSKLHELFTAWCKAAGEREWTQKGFSQAMLDKGFEKKASDGMQWLGMTMTRYVSEFVDEHGKPISFTIEDAAPTPPVRDGPSPPGRAWPDDDDVI